MQNCHGYCSFLIEFRREEPMMIPNVAVHRAKRHTAGNAMGDKQSVKGVARPV